jgi:hypothetical protein
MLEEELVGVPEEEEESSGIEEESSGIEEEERCDRPLTSLPSRPMKPPPDAREEWCSG